MSSRTRDAAQSERSTRWWRESGGQVGEVESASKCKNQDIVTVCASRGMSSRSKHQQVFADLGGPVILGELIQFDSPKFAAVFETGAAQRAHGVHTYPGRISCTQVHTHRSARRGCSGADPSLSPSFPILIAGDELP